MPDKSLPSPPAQSGQIPQRGNVWLVFLWMMGALASFCIMAISVRELAARLSIFEVLAFRNGTALIILSLFLAARPVLWRDLNFGQIKGHFARNLTHSAAQFCWALSLTLLPLATVFAIEFSMPAWATLLAVFFLGERLTLNRFATVLLGMIGVLIIVRPGLDGFRLASLLVLAAAFGYAVVVIVTKRLTRTESTFAILVFMNAIQFVIHYAFSDPLFVFKMGSGQLWPALGIALAGLSSHYCQTNAFRAGDAITVSSLEFLRLPMIAVLGYLLYGEQLDAFALIGGGILVAGVLYGLAAENRRI